MLYRIRCILITLIFLTGCGEGLVSHPPLGNPTAANSIETQAIHQNQFENALTGVWKISRMACDGEDPARSIQSLYLENSFYFHFDPQDHTGKIQITNRGNSQNMPLCISTLPFRRRIIAEEGTQQYKVLLEATAAAQSEPHGCGNQNALERARGRIRAFHDSVSQVAGVNLVNTGWNYLGTLIGASMGVNPANFVSGRTVGNYIFGAQPVAPNREFLDFFLPEIATMTIDHGEIRSTRNVDSTLEIHIKNYYGCRNTGHPFAPNDGWLFLELQF